MGGEYPLADSFQAKEPGTEPVMVQRFEGWAPEGLDSHLRTNKVRVDYGQACIWPRPKQAIAWDALSCVQDQQEVSEWDPTEGRRRAPRANQMALGTTREALWYFWSASLDHKPTPIEWGTGLHLDLPDNSSPEMSLLVPLLSNEKDAQGPHKKDRETSDRPLAPRRGSGALPATKPRPSDPSSHSGARQTTPSSEQKGCARATQKSQGNF